MIAQGTRCKQYLFSISLNPPENENVPVTTFEDAIDRIEKKLGLEGQPRAIVFHEKNARRHAHCVWSRIDVDEMTAINLPFYKTRLMEVSKELYLEHGWNLPPGFINREQRNPLNFSREQWQQAKRLGDSPETIKTILKECWAVSHDKACFMKALDDKGYYLAQGDRRGYVAVDWRGECYSLSRWLGVKTKDLKHRLGEPEKLPAVAQIKTQIDQTMRQRVQNFVQDIKAKYDRRRTPFESQKSGMKDRHRHERKDLLHKQKERWNTEAIERQARITKGLRGFWDRIIGNHAKTLKNNERERENAICRDRQEKETLILRQLQERRGLQQSFKHHNNQYHKELQTLKEMLFSKMPEEHIHTLTQEFKTPYPTRDRSFSFNR
ncbi:MAG: relaxase [Pseudomonadota bacterium]